MIEVNKMTREEIEAFIEETYTLNLQNLNDRLSEIECFKEGIKVGVAELLFKQEREHKEMIDTSDANLNIGGVSGCFSFVKYVKGWYEYNDNTANGDVYNNVVTGKLMTEQQIFDEWLKLNNR